MRISLLSFLLIFSASLFAQEDDFFLQSEDKEATESSVFADPNDLSGYYDDVVHRTMMEQSPFLEKEPVSESDIVWQKRIWRIVDTREKMNLHWRNPDVPFFGIIKDMAEAGDIKVFRDEFFKEPLAADELSGLIFRIDTAVVYDPETYEEQIKITKSEIDVEDIKRYRIKEVWYFDKEASRVRSQILGIAPIKDEVDATTGELKYSLPLFWVYYPKATEQLSRRRVVNEYNEVGPISWYQLFESRMFSSYIYKQNNSLGLRLEDIYKDSPDTQYDVLLESQKIENELFNFEHDLWTY